MSGYTALMQQNEQLAKIKHRRLKEVLESSVSFHHGKILQYYGDGALSIFNSAVDGVKCAVEIQQALQQEPKVDLRIGIHTGDISIEDETIYGGMIPKVTSSLSALDKGLSSVMIVSGKTPFYNGEEWKGTKIIGKE